jgi:PAS domain S-box-containing protein
MQTKGQENGSGNRNMKDSIPDYQLTAPRNKEGPELSTGKLSPLRLLAIIIGGIFMAEIVAMLVVYALEPLPFIQLTLLDAGIMTVLIFPVLYFLSFRPLLLYIKKSQEDEEKNRQLFRIVEQTADSVVVTDFAGVIKYVNPAFEQMTGFTRAEALGKTPRVLKSGVHNDQFYTKLWQTILDGEAFQSEIANRKKNGELYYEEKTITPLRDERGNITHFVATGKDISERVRAEEQLRRAYDELELRVQARTEELRIANSELEEEIIERKRVESMLQQQTVELEMQAEELQVQKRDLIVANEMLLQSRLDLDRAQEVGQIGSWRLDVLRNILTWSDENYCIFGIPLGTPLTYETFLGIVHPDDRQHVDMRWYEGLAGAPYDIEHRLLVDGQVKWVREKAYLEFDDTGNPLGAFGITQDITERVEAEKAVKESEEKYRSLFDNMSEGFGLHEIILDADGKPCDYRFLEINDAFERLTGLSRDKILGRTVKDVMPDIEPHWFETYGRVALSGESVHYINYNAPLEKWFEAYCYSPGQDLFAVVFFDITERKQAEEALRQGEERYRLALDAAALGTWRHDPATGLLSLDERARSHSGFESDTVTLAQVFALIHPDDVARVEHEINIALDPVNSTGYYATEYRIIHPDGGIRWISVQASIYFEGQGTTRHPVQVIGLSQEITERKHAEEALRAANEELTRFNTLMVGRELRMIELKREVNELCASNGQPLRHPLDFEKEER